MFLKDQNIRNHRTWKWDKYTKFRSPKLWYKLRSTLFLPHVTNETFRQGEKLISLLFKYFKIVFIQPKYLSNSKESYLVPNKIMFEKYTTWPKSNCRKMNSFANMLLFKDKNNGHKSIKYKKFSLKLSLLCYIVSIWQNNFNMSLPYLSSPQYIWIVGKTLW